MVAGSGGVNGGGSVRVVRSEDARVGVLERRRLSERELTLNLNNLNSK